jgi:hypothetical protein
MPVAASVLQGNNHPEVSCLSEEATAHLLEWPRYMHIVPKPTNVLLVYQSKIILSKVKLISWLFSKHIHGSAFSNLYFCKKVFSCL